jgi:hypothetical protein
VVTGDRYWSIDLPGLNQDQAEELIGIAERAGMLSYGGSVVDPGRFLTFHLDKETVDSLRRALAFAQVHHGLSSESDRMIVAAVLEELDEWFELTIDVLR